MRSLSRRTVNALYPLFVITGFLVLGVSCSGSGDTLAGGGIGGTGVTVASVGTITGFGSVIVNGVVYETTGAEVFVENTLKGSGDPAVIRYLSPGMVVRVEGRLSTGGAAGADRVFFSNDLKGAVESMREPDSFPRLVILGQTIVMDDRTVFQGAAPASIVAGMVLEVSGYPDEAGNLVATYVKKVADSLAPDDRVEIKGVVQNLVPGLQTFRINRLTVDYSGSDFGGRLQTGQLLRVVGRPGEVDLLIADRLEPEEEFGPGTFELVDLEGIITHSETPGEFRIGRYTISVDPQTSYIDLTPQDLSRGTRVIVHGTLADRVIFADEIRSVRRGN
jgi:hypothetical protein